MKTSSPQTLEELRAHVVASLNDLVEKASDGHWLTTDFHEARLTLEALPLTTAEIASARNRLENARRYLEQGERGAARFELRLLRLQLSSIGG